MKAIHTLLTLLASGLLSEALSHAGHANQHAHVARSLTSRHEQPIERAHRINKRCAARVPSPIPSSTVSSTHSSAHSTSTKKASSAKASSTTAVSSGSSSSSSTDIFGLIKVSSSGPCGASGAQKQITATNGPNGNLEWLNCGVNGGGWNPPYVSVWDIVTSELSEAVKEDGSPFQACSAYIDLFEQYGNEYGLPSILLASFAMQESSCNPNTVGGAGEQGLMQLTKDKCGAAPGGNCKDPNYNIETGAQYFSSSLNDNGGDLLLTIGQYNGWYRGLTYDEATAAGNTNCCRCQNNLDYLQQFMNGWLQNIDAYTHNPPLGQYFNLNKCGN